ncbi:MAG: hypothetical protein GY936_00755, partial [Ignavibacteriae bacterium]|nr:hypothetical protein [Ignavibacteriota bacterium]
LSIEKGLSQIAVNSILQDSKGFLWFGTEDGLNRYDGYKFEIFKPDPSNINSISDNFIWTIFEDSKNNLWIGTNSGGLNKYNYETNSFEHFTQSKEKMNSISGNNIRVIFEDNQNILWIGNNNGGLDKYNENKNLFEQVDLLIGDDVNNTNSIRAICEDEQENLWIATDGSGLLKFDKTRKKSFLYEHSVENKNSLNSNSIWSLLAEGNNIWIGTYNNGLNKFNLEEEKFTHYTKKENGLGLVNDNITNLMIDNSNHLWVSTEGGLSILNIETEVFCNYQHSISDMGSISNNFVRTVIQDNSGLIWIGTVGGGINKVNLNKKFKHYAHNPSDENSLSHNVIRSIYEDTKGNLWVGTLGKGLNTYDKKQNIFQHFLSNSSLKYSLSENIVSSIFEDSYENLWVGTWGGGLNKISFSNNSNRSTIKKIAYYKHNHEDTTSINSNIVQAIFEDSKQNVWIGTEEGLDLYNSKSDEFFHFKNEKNNKNSLSDNRIQSKCIVEDRFGNLWVGTWRGLNRVVVRDKINKNSLSQISFKKCLHDPSNPNSISDNRVLSIYEDESITSQDSLILWVGTIGGGLNKLTILMKSDTLDNIKFKNYTENDGLSNNVIYGILGDDAGDLWLSTNNGISRFTPVTEEFRKFDIKDGLQSNQFFWGAFHKTKDGELFFGGVNGLNSFYPNSLQDNKHIPPIYITDFSIIASTQEKQNKTIQTTISSYNKIIYLPYDAYTLNFEFAALDFTTPEKNEYKYMFDGIDENWNSSLNKNYTQYSNIKEGEYEFKVIGSNNDGIWNKTGASITIIIDTPFWKTWWFTILGLLILAVLVGYFIYSQVQNMLAVERLRTKLAADLHDNIGSSLTEISILSEVISAKLKTSDKDINKSLNKISYKSRNLIDKMSDIVWLVNPQRDSLYDLILRLQDTYSELLADTSISFRSENLKSLEKISLSMEHRQHLFLIFKEAINNSITHSTCTEIFLNAKVHGKKLEMVLEDNGMGFEFDETKRGNGLVNMKKRSKKIDGKLRIKSELGKGTMVKYIGKVV